MSDHQTDRHPVIPRILRVFCVPVLLGWLALTVILNVVVPQLEVVGEKQSVSLTPDDAPSLQAMKLIGKVFKESDSNSSAMIVLEGDNPLGIEAHKYYDGLVTKLEADTKHVQHVQNFWGDPLTSAGVQSADGKAAYVQLYLAGNQGEALANESAQAVKDAVAAASPPAGLKVYVTGQAALLSDQQRVGDKSLQLVTAVTIGVIVVTLLLVYRSIVAVATTIVLVLLELAAARGIVAFLGYHGVIGLSTFAVNLLTLT